MKDLHKILEIKGKLDQWAQITIGKFQKELRRQKIGVTDELYNSFVAQVQQEHDELLGIVLKFKFYGRLRDMGVGRGLIAHARGLNRADRAGAAVGANVSFINRRPKKWYNKTKMSQVYRLKEILGSDMGRDASAYVTDAFNEMGVQNIKI